MSASYERIQATNPSGQVNRQTRGQARGQASRQASGQKRLLLVALFILTAGLSLCFASTAFAEDGNYSSGEASEQSGAVNTGLPIEPFTESAAESASEPEPLPEGTTASDQPVVEPLEEWSPSAVLSGWVKDSGGWKYYVNGNPLKGLQTLKVTIEGQEKDRKFYFATNGYRLSGWQKISGSWYFFDQATSADETGSQMQNGWLLYDGSWFYLDPTQNGKMLIGWQKLVRDGETEAFWYFFKEGDSGRMRTGWLYNSDGWFYLDPQQDGKMLTGLQSLADSKGVGLFAFRGGDSGRMLTGWQKLAIAGESEKHWYFFDTSSGKAVKGWLNNSGGWFYLDPANCQMLTGLQKLRWSKGESYFYFRGGDSGRMLSGWQKLTLPGSSEQKWYYFAPGDGNNKKGWLYWDSSWFYLDTANDGAMLTGWQKLPDSEGTHWYCFKGGDSGRMMKGWADDNGTKRFLDDQGIYRGEGFDKMIKEITDSIGYSGDTLYKSFQYVSTQFNYRSGSLNPSGHFAAGFAQEMYSRGSGNCYRYASLFCMLALAYGYDAQVVVGYVPSVSSGWAPHGWVEINHNGKAIVCDPDLQHEISNRNWYWITYANAPVTYRWW